MTQELTKESIIKLLETNDKAVARALVVLFERQTATEQSCDGTIEHNGVGFTGAHGFIGCQMAKYYIRRGFLSEKQIAYWRHRSESGRMRIAMYWKQLIEAAQEKQKTAC